MHQTSIFDHPLRGRGLNRKYVKLAREKNHNTGGFLVVELYAISLQNVIIEELRLVKFYRDENKKYNYNSI